MLVDSFIKLLAQLVFKNKKVHIRIINIEKDN